MSFLRGFISRITGNYSAKVSIADDEIDAERFGQYGLYSKPGKNVQTLMLRRGDSLVIVGERNPKMSITLQDGDVALFDGFNKIILQGKKGILIDAPGGIKIGSLAKKLLTDLFLKFYEAHTHNCASPGSPSGPPIIPVGIVKGIVTEILEAT